MARAVLIGKVLFSMIILEDCEYCRICRAVFSQYCRSAAPPLPIPNVFVGVLTLTKTISWSRMQPGMSVLKKRFRPQVALMISSSPGS